MLETEYPVVRPGPPVPGNVIQPGVFSMPPGTERYVVQGTGAILFPVEQGDKFTVVNDEGGQACEIVAADASGKIDAGVLGRKPNSDAAGLKALLAGSDHSLRGLRMGLESRNIDLAGAGAVGFFNAQTRHGEEVELAVQRDGVVVVAAPGGAMDMEAQDTSTPLTVMVTRAVVKSQVKFELPDPLADPVLDLRIHTATAESYFVKAGDFIQILDVDGRQCTDFQCFAARKLDKGTEHALDVTTTRALMGHAYPMPGLHAKYYDTGYAAPGRGDTGHGWPA